jgi:hypothetical protein
MGLNASIVYPGGGAVWCGDDGGFVAVWAVGSGGEGDYGGYEFLSSSG